MGLRDDALAAAGVSREQLTEATEDHVETVIAAWCVDLGIAELPSYEITSTLVTPPATGLHDGSAFSLFTFVIDGIEFTGSAQASVHGSQIKASTTGIRHKNHRIENMQDLGNALR